MLRVGLTGGLASGKSFIAHVLEDAGCHVVHADQLGHEVLQPGAEAYAAVVAEFGHGILNEDGLIDRRRLAALVFDHPDRLAVLNNLVHPAVFERQDQLLRTLDQQDPNGIVVVEAETQEPKYVLDYHAGRHLLTTNEVEYFIMAKDETKVKDFVSKQPNVKYAVLIIEE